MSEYQFDDSSYRCGVRRIQPGADPSTSVVNEYNFGDFRGDEGRLMEHVSDTHLYPPVRLRPTCGPCRPLVTGASSGSSPYVR
ncbi:hypothetical protein [Streptomyces sp. NPDC059909]|uniref:hypothetical protein n=1 Tax=Streptomyces sp. NPDC059909 TaxID=3346998 RepID=UPI003654A4CF